MSEIQDAVPPLNEPRRPYTEIRMISALARNTFKDMLCCVDNTYAIGSECDLLVVTCQLRCIDVEVKISRADLKADAKKDKWHTEGGYNYGTGERYPRIGIMWPRNVWKHYYAIAADIWRDDLLEHCQPNSGVLVVNLSPSGEFRSIDVKRRCRANSAQQPLAPADLCNIARLTSLRLWDARKALEARQ